MSTRGFYRFVDAAPAGTPAAVYNIYRQSDNYPSGGLDAIIAALRYAWTLPRYEADEFAAAFCAGYKSHYLKRVLDDVLAKAQPLFDAAPESYELLRVDQVAIDPMAFKGYNGGGIRVQAMGDDWRSLAPPDIEYLWTVYPGEGSVVRGGWQPNEIVLFVRCEYVRCGDWDTSSEWSSRVEFDVPLTRVQTLLDAHDDFEVVAKVLQAQHAGAEQDVGGGWVFENKTYGSLEELVDLLYDRR